MTCSIFSAFQHFFTVKLIFNFEIGTMKVQVNDFRFYIDRNLIGFHINDHQSKIFLEISCECMFNVRSFVC